LEECKILEEEGKIAEVYSSKVSGEEDPQRDNYFNLAGKFKANIVGIPKNKDDDYVFYKKFQNI